MSTGIFITGGIGPRHHAAAVGVKLELVGLGRHNFLRIQPRRLPAVRKDQAAGVKVINPIDSMSSKSISMPNQNYSFVGRKAG